MKGKTVAYSIYAAVVAGMIAVAVIYTRSAP